MSIGSQTRRRGHFFRFMARIFLSESEGDAVEEGGIVGMVFCKQTVKPFLQSLVHPFLRGGSGIHSDISKGVGEVRVIVRSVVRVGCEKDDSLIGTLHRQQTVLAGHLPAHGFHLQAHGILHAVVVQATEVEHAVLAVRGERSFAERVGTVGDAEILVSFLRYLEADGDDIGGIGDKGAAFVGHAIRRFVCHGGKG